MEAQFCGIDFDGHGVVFRNLNREVSSTLTVSKSGQNQMRRNAAQFQQHDIGKLLKMSCGSSRGWETRVVGMGELGLVYVRQETCQYPGRQRLRVNGKFADHGAAGDGPTPSAADVTKAFARTSAFQ
jgi:hypothetical protein